MFIHVVASVIILFLFKAKRKYILCLYHLLLTIHPLIGKRLFPLFGYEHWCTNIYLFMFNLVFSYFGFIPRSRIAGSYSNSMLDYWFNQHCFHSSGNLPFYISNRIKFPNCSHPHSIGLLVLP